MRDRDHDAAMAQLFARDPSFAVELLDSVLADGDVAELEVTLRQLALAFAVEHPNQSAAVTLQAVRAALASHLAARN